MTSDKLPAGSDLPLRELSLLIQQQRRAIVALQSAPGPAPGRVLLTAVALAGAVMVMTGAAYASGPVRANLIHGCYSKKTKAVSITKKTSCPSGTLTIDWNQYSRLTASAPLSTAPGSSGGPAGLGLTGVVPVANGGTGSASRNFVDLSSSQVVGGPKTFSSPIGGSITGNAATVTNGLYSTGSYDDPSWLTALSGAKITGTVASATTSESFSGGISGDVTGAQKATTVGALQGTPLSPESPVPGQSLVYDGTSWAPQGVYNPLQLAELNWYGSGAIANSVPVSFAPRGLAFDGADMWVANEGGGTVSEVDVATHAVINTVTVGSLPYAVAFDGFHIWVANEGSNNVSEVDVQTDTVINTVSVGTGPEGIAFDGTHVWVANTGADTLSEISDGASPAVLNTVTVGQGPLGIAFDGSHMWVAISGAKSLSEVSDGAAPAVVDTVAVGSSPSGVAFDGSHIWVANGGSGSVSEIEDNATPAVVNTVTVEPSPQSLVFDGRHIWVGCGGVVNEIDASSHSVVNTVDDAESPGGLAFDGSNIWVVNESNNSISVL